jgi:hypothetical protein
MVNHVGTIRTLIGAMTLLRVGAMGLPAGAVAQQSGPALVLACQSTFTRDDDAAALAMRFGAPNVVDGDVYVGEGQYESGTVLFPAIPEQRAEILWKDSAARRLPATVRIHEDRSRWTTPEGVSIGTRLKEVERVNRRPFRLTGFGWDYGGTTTDWSGGRLDQADAPCVLWLRFSLGPVSGRTAGQIMGERRYSSGHPAMQTLNPSVWQMGLRFPD